MGKLRRRTSGNQRLHIALVAVTLLTRLMQDRTVVLSHRAGSTTDVRKRATLSHNLNSNPTHLCDVVQEPISSDQGPHDGLSLGEE
jgi:hypothetical protein